VGFFFDSLRSMLAGSEEARLASRAAMAGRLWNIEGRIVTHGDVPDDLGLQIFHFPKGGKHRSFAVTMTIGPVAEHKRELFVCTLADSADDTANPWARILAHVASTEPEPQVGEVIALPDGALGRSSHRHVLLAPSQSLSARELPDYESVLETPLIQLVTLTDREAEWIGERGADAFLEVMAEQKVTAFADRRPGDTRL